MKELTTEYYKDEVRCGFYVPTAIKQAWATGLMVLAEIDRICQKYDIAYFADWGTMLGAVRHGGFVPWDDDLDICMTRENYTKFRQVADQELPEDFAIHDYERKEGHWLFLARVVNCNHVSFDVEHLDRYHNFPYMATVDIFVKDYQYRDEQKEKERCEEVKYILAVAQSVIDDNRVDVVSNKIYKDLEMKYHMTFPKTTDARTMAVALYRLAEQQIARVPEEEAERIDQVFPWGLKGTRGVPKEYYDKLIRVPFENTTIPVPENYNVVLRSRYGEYLQVHKIWDGHMYPYFEGQRADLQAVADFQLPEFTFSSDMLRENRQKQEVPDSFKSIVKECMEQIDGIQTAIMETMEQQAYELVLELLGECQQMVVDLGSFIEEVKGEQNEVSIEIVERLQAYCEAIFAIFDVLTSEESTIEDVERLPLLSETAGSILEQVKTVVAKQIYNRKSVLFVTTGLQGWKRYEKIYKTVIQDKQTDVYVVAVPTFFKNIYGQIVVSKDAEEVLTGFPEDVEFTPYEDFNVGLVHPDIIYIQDPYDGENPCLTIPPAYYAGNLQLLTEELIYIPVFVADEFGMQDPCDVYNMKHYVTAPALMHADKVYVPSENTRQMYLQALVSFMGDRWKNDCEQKVMVEESIFKKESSEKEKKSLFYCIGENELAECESAISLIKERMEIFKKNSSQLDVVVGYYPYDETMWELYEDGQTKEICDLIAAYTKEDWCSLRDLRKDNECVADQCNAYYGSPSPVVLDFTRADKPVMISRN